MSLSCRPKNIIELALFDRIKLLKIPKVKQREELHIANNTRQQQKVSRKIRKCSVRTTLKQHGLCSITLKLYLHNVKENAPSQLLLRVVIDTNFFLSKTVMLES